jgi:ubiquinone biosynthesis protein COQ4
MTAPAATTAPRRDWSSGLSSLLRFIRGRGGLEDAFEGMLALAGPTVEREFQAFAAHPTGRAMLDERPRRELVRFLADRERLRAMPPGSMAAAYLDYMGGAGMGTAEAFLQAAGVEGKAARFGWSDDHLWFVRRMANGHDLFHVVAGYGRDVVGEVGVDAYTAGQMSMLPLRIFLGYLYLLKPSEPLAWTRFVSEAYRRGKRTPSLACVDYEALFPLPLEEARRQIGVPPLAEAHRRGFPSKGRWLDRIERNIEGGKPETAHA